MSAIAEVESWVAGALHVVRVTDEDGRSGLGAGACWAYPGASAAIVETLRTYLLGKDPRRIEDHWYAMHRMGPFRGSVLGGAVSAVDTALWDLKARALDVPVFELLGGRARDRIRLHALLLGWSSFDDLFARARDAAQEGFTAVKVDPTPAGAPSLPLPALARDLRHAAEVAREAVGEDVDLIFELHRSFTPLQASTAIESLAAVRPLFVEDPIQIDSLRLQGLVAARSATPLGQGERAHSSWEVRELLQDGGPQFVRCDVGLAGGLTHGRRIAAVAEAFGASVCWHTFSGPLLTAAAAHLETTLPNVATHEWWAPIEEPGQIPAFSAEHRREGGWLHVADVPGLGIAFDPSRLAPIDVLGRPLHEVPRRPDGSVALAV